ncbi:MAG: hypothetical protein A4E48_00194 [Methanosaeta sp. PtaU1.Bin060]|nr:MAG: hypothetical protein A4E48_00194 [Methanosaeta sp. PtaU1.Bin060]
MKGESTVLDWPCDLCNNASQNCVSEKWIAKATRRGKRQRSIPVWAQLVHSWKGTAMNQIMSWIIGSEIARSRKGTAVGDIHCAGSDIGVGECDRIG